MNSSIVLTPAGMSFDTIVQGIGTTGQGVVVLYAPDVPITSELIDKWINIFPKKGSYAFRLLIMMRARVGISFMMVLTRT